MKKGGIDSCECRRHRLRVVQIHGHGFDLVTPASPDPQRIPGGSPHPVTCGQELGDYWRALGSSGTENGD